MKHAIRFILVVSLTINLVAGFYYFQNRVPQEVKSDLPYQDNLTKFISYVDGYFTGISQKYKYYQSPLYCPVRDPINHPASPFEEGYSRGVRMSEKKCDDAYDMKIGNEESVAEMLRNINSSYIRCEEEYEKLYEEYIKIDYEKNRAIRKCNKKDNKL